MFDLINLGLQLTRSYDGLNKALQGTFPNGNVPVAFTEFAAASSGLLNFTTTIAANWTQYQTGAQFASAISPLTSALSGISLAGNVTADVMRVIQAYDSGDEAAINKSLAQLMAATAGALIFTALALYFGVPVLALAGWGYLLGGFAPSLLNFLKDPLVLDLDGDGVELSALGASSVHFDFGGDGFAELTGWVNPDDGILAIDDNENGLIDNGLELFGSSTQDGFAVLEKLDTNADGRIDVGDEDFSKLVVWQDLNQNGVSDPGELKSLTELGISSIALSRTNVSGSNEGHEIGFSATFTRNGATQIAQTIYFATDGRDTVHDSTPTFTVATGVDLLPQLAGSGLIASIAYRATNDAVFREAWTALTDNAAHMSIFELRASFEDMMLQWADVDDVDPASRGYFVDARHLAFIERFFGETYRELERDLAEARTFPSTFLFGQNIEATYKNLVDTLQLVFLTQIGPSVAFRGGDADQLITSPYFLFALLDLSEPDEEAPPLDTPGNVGLVVDLVLAMTPRDAGAAVTYLSSALVGLEGVIPTLFDDNRSAFAAMILPRLEGLSDGVIREIAEKIVSGEALLGSTLTEGISGDSSDNVIIGGGGGDVVSGGAGSDIYVYAKSDGDLWIKDDSASTTQTDRLVLTDLNSSDVTFQRIGDNLIVKVTSTNKSIVVEQFFQSWTTQNKGIDIVRFSDGTELDRTHIQSVTTFEGNGYSNYIADGSTNDVIHGSLGNDVIRISGGNDTVLYGKGDGYDIIDNWNSQAETDTLYLTDLNPDDVELTRSESSLLVKIKSTGEIVELTNNFSSSKLLGDLSRQGIDQIKFANGIVWGRDQIEANAWHRGSDGRDVIARGYGGGYDDTIVGGKGADDLTGGDGGDMYIWSKGDGDDRITDADSSGAKLDTLYLKDVLPGDVRYSYSGDDLLITIVPTGEIIRVTYFFQSAGNLLEDAYDQYYGIDIIKFANGQTIDRAAIYRATGEQFLGRDREITTISVNGGIINQYFVDEFGHSGNMIGVLAGIGPHDLYQASSDYNSALDGRLSLGDAHNNLIGREGNDTLIGSRGSDVLVGNGGNDALIGDDPNDDHGGNDVLQGGTGNDSLYGGIGSDSLSGDSGNDRLYGDEGADLLYGGTGDDVYVGGAGDDAIVSGNASASGSDTFIFAKGDGHDTIDDTSSSIAGPEIDTLVLSDINKGDVELSRSGFDLLIKVISTGETIVVHSQFQWLTVSAGTTQAGSGLEFIRFADGEEWNRALIEQQAKVLGTNGNDVLYTDVVGDVFNDIIVGGKGDDIINSGASSSGSGNDTFVYSKGDGNDTIREGTQASYSEFDILQLTDLTSTEVQLARSGADLLVTILETGEKIIVQSQFVETSDAAGKGLEAIRFANGEEWSRQRIQQEAWYRGTNGNDVIQTEVLGIRWNDVIEAGKGNDVIYAGSFNAAGSDTFVYAKGDGNDTVSDLSTASSNPQGTDTLRFKDINSSEVTLNRVGNSLQITVTETGETITVINQFTEAGEASGTGIEVIEFANGETWSREAILGSANSSSSFMVGTRVDDVITGSSVSQNIYGEAGNDIIDGMGGSDLLYGGLGDDLVRVHISTSGDVNSIVGGAGTDTVDATNFASAVWIDLVTSGAEMRTRDQADLSAGTWRDVAQIQTVENITGSQFSDQIFGDAGNNALIGNAGNDTLDGRSGDDKLIGGEGNDTLTGGMGADILEGGNGNDILAGNIGSDIIDGGNGNDTMSGGTEADIFVFSVASGQDVITDFVAGAGSGHDIVRLDRSIFPNFAALLAAATQVGADVVIDDGNGNTLTLQNIKLANLTAENFEFRRVGNEAPTAVVVQGGTVAEDLAPGSVVATLDIVDDGDSGPHTFEIVSGNASLFEIVGNEVRLKSGVNLDFESANSHTLSIKGIDDDGMFVVSPLTINVTNVTETFSGGSGDDSLVGGSASDIFIGGEGNDRLSGWGGSDEYRYNLGDGDDRIVESSSTQSTDRLILGPGILSSDIIVGRSSLNNRDLVLRLADSSTIVLQDQISDLEGSGVEFVEFNNGAVWTRADILNHLQSGLVIGTSLADTLTGSAGADSFEAGAGNDTLRGYGGSDTYRIAVSDGEDRIFEDDEAGTDRLELVDTDSADVRVSRVGNDLIIRVDGASNVITLVNQFGGSASGVEEIEFADGVIWTAQDIRNVAFIRGTSGNDTLVGTAEDEVFFGDAGNDTIKGGDGSDTVVYALGDGSDVIDDGANGSASIDILKLTDLDASDLILSRQGTDLLITIGSTGETIKVLKQFTSQADFWGIERVSFADGTTWDKSQIREAAWIRGTSAGETLTGSAESDTIDGAGGADTLKGAAGGDTYIYGVGSGNDSLTELSSDAGVDIVKLRGLNSTDVVFARSSNDLKITIVSTGEVLTVVNQFSGTNGVELVAFADATAWDRDQISVASAIRGTTGNDILTGTSGNDIFIGGLGDDRFNSGAGSDTYIYAQGDGNDYINDEAGSTVDVDVVRFTDLNSNDLTFSRSGVHLVVTVNSTGQTVTFDEQFYSQTSNWGIERVEFANGEAWNLGTINGNAWIRGTAGNDTLSGSSWNDTFSGGLGNDTFNSGTGSDTYIYASGDGNDYINDESSSTTEVDVLRFTNLTASGLTFSHVGVNLVIGVNSTGQTITIDEHFYSPTSNYGVERIEFSDGEVWNLSTINSMAWIRGTSGNDAINGSSFGDVIAGGAGDDTPHGNSGNDTYIYALGDGNDLIQDNGLNGDVDVLKFVNLNASDLTVSRSISDNRDVLITVNSTGERITIDNQTVSAGSAIEKFQFADGSIWDSSAILTNSQKFIGTASAETISGTTGNDVIIGNGGNDTLTGNAGTDTFVFGSGFGQDKITDFALGTDVIEFRDGLFADASAVLASATASGANTLITVNASTTLLLQNVAVANLHVDDFRIA